VLATYSVIEILGDRIERAYRRRRPSWRGVCSTPRVWGVAAETLIQAHLADHSLPLDPELYVLAQPCDAYFANPWGELTGATAVGYYRTRVDQIIDGLRSELANEVRRAEGRIVAGQSAARVVLSRSRKLSPLGRYIVAVRAGRPALARRFLHGVAEQHRSCPLYQLAYTTFLPAETYPVPGPSEPPGRPAPSPDVCPQSQSHWN
jgi:hypothetical protein